jgi:hypothetical protein
MVTSGIYDIWNIVSGSLGIVSYLKIQIYEAELRNLVR